MLPATEHEISSVHQYMASQAPDLTVVLVQKVYSETILSARHDVWDVHTDVDRWWVITAPMNLYAQDQFPNMDLALTFHIGLCLRIPRSDHNKLSDLPVEPFAECYRSLQEAADALRSADEVSDYQTIGVRCRESLLSFVSAAQRVLPWTAKEESPKKADFRAWAEHICSAALPGASHEQRRALLKSTLESAWNFANWLTHTKASRWHDAEAAVDVTERRHPRLQKHLAPSARRSNGNDGFDFIRAISDDFAGERSVCYFDPPKALEGTEFFCDLQVAQ